MSVEGMRVCPYCFASLTMYLSELPKVKCPEGCGIVQNDFIIDLEREDLCRKSSQH